MSNSTYYRVQLTGRAKKDLRKIGKRKGKSTYEKLRDLINDLEFEPAEKGDALTGPLRGFFSLHYSRYRVIYVVEEGEARVIAVSVGYHESGSRHDIYRIVTRLVEMGAIDPEIVELGEDEDA